ncbi:Mannosylglycerate hydrolase [Candidatus Izimaplasma bacterium HR1]|jgi:alpha-mannosidase|uniref:alpha-mannosidase n=1 Tax=Candidatus Izimoplasma sp. HR1 TaxID=1541959 RepID=UPI0004F66BE7|nr:Mannosylglycerate hydrolase [Candidatus Izimaplasma bacterium HR1]
MFFYLERLKKTCNELSKNIYTEKYELNDLMYKQGDYLSFEEANKDVSTFSIYNSLTYINNANRYWFQKRVVLNDDFLGSSIVFEIETGKEQGWDAINPQFLVYINGEAIQGFDTNHRTVIIDTNKLGLDFVISFHAYTGTQKDDVNIRCYISKIQKEIKKIYFDLSILEETLQVLDPETAEYNLILNTCNNAVDILDFRSLEKLINSSCEASRIIEDAVYSYKHNPLSTVSLLGHTHIDVAWLWTLKQTREKVVRSFSTVVKLMEEYEHYRFMSSQPQLYQFVKEDNPSLYQKIKELVKEGRWEVEGGMWLESDCNIPSGESLIRQLQKGKTFFKNEFAVDSKILWLPDVFGYSAALPQILKSIGIKYFLTTKISWNESNKMPYDTFYWKGLDGTEILTYFGTTNEYEKVINNDHRTIYEGTINPSQVQGTYTRYQQKLINNNTLMIYGHGDGGGGPTSEMLEYSQRLIKGIPGLPQVKEVNSIEYFTELEKKVANNDKTPKWRGELYLEYHRGTYTTSSKSKKYNRRSEQLVHDLEFISVLFNKLYSYPINHKLINKSWDVILLNQFHDIIPGTSIKEVYDESFTQYNEIISTMESQITKTISPINSQNEDDSTIQIINTTSFTRDDIVVLNKYNPIYQSLCYKDKLYPIQETFDNKVIVHVPSIIPFGISKYQLSKELSGTNILHQSTSKLENDYLVLSFDSIGYITSIFDKDAQRELIEEGMIANQLVAYEDIPHNWDAWDINKYYKYKSYPLSELESSVIIEDGPVRTVLRQTRKYNKSLIKQDIIMYSHTRRIDFETTIDWNEKQTLLRTLFPLTVSNQYATYEIQYGNVKRTTHENTSWDHAMFEVPAQKWADLSDGNYGVSLINDSKYGYSIKDSVIGLSLLKSSQWPCLDIDKGNHTFTYSLYPHLNTYSEGGTIKEAYKLNYPLYTTPLLKRSDNHFESLFKVTNENIVIEVVKQDNSNNYITLRIYESQNCRTKTTLTSHYDILHAYEVNLVGEIQSKLEICENKVEITFTPFEIKTIYIEL